MRYRLDFFATIGVDGEILPEKADAMKKYLKFLTLTAAALMLGGCASRRNAAQSDPYQPPPPPRIYGQPPPGAIIVQPGQSPPGAFPTQPPPPPPGSFPTAPPGPGASNPFPTSPQPGGFPTAPPAPPGPPSTSNVPSDVRDRVGFRWEATPPATRPASPPQPPAGPSGVLLLPPTPEPSTNKDEPRRQLYPPTPPATKEPAALPVGIAGFDRARDNVATGQRPTLEGLDWLQKSNYRTIVFLHLPGESTDADRQQIEKRGLNFVSIEINPKDLNREQVERFLRVQTDHRAEKLFVYDLDGSLAGAMWYLSFRILDQDSDDVARVKAGSLGQREDRESARELWVTVRKYVEQK